MVNNLPYRETSFCAAAQGIAPTFEMLRLTVTSIRLNFSYFSITFKAQLQSILVWQSATKEWRLSLPPLDQKCDEPEYSGRQTAGKSTIAEVSVDKMPAVFID